MRGQSARQDTHGFKVKEVDYLDGDEAGLKSAVLLVEGAVAHGGMWRFPYWR